jgi:hypothetical protein
MIEPRPALRLFQRLRHDLPHPLARKILVARDRLIGKAGSHHAENPNPPLLALAGGATGDGGW